MNAPSPRGDLLIQALSVDQELDRLILAAPHTEDEAGARHVQLLRFVSQQTGRLVTMIGEDITIRDDYSNPEAEALLCEILGAVQLKSGRLLAATADRHGVDAALKALAEMTYIIGDTTAETGRVIAMARDLVEEQAKTVTLELYVGRSDVISETIEGYHVPRIPVRDDELELEGRRLARVSRVRMRSRGEALVRAKVWAKAPEPAEDF